jgi:short-subunit dehydrogenase
MTDSVIIVGGSSGIGETLARRMAAEGYEVGLTARSLDRLKEIGRELPTKSYVARMDVTETEAAREIFAELVAEMGGVDIVVLSAGVAPPNPDLSWEEDRQTIETNVLGFAALATAAVEVFDEQGSGHLVGISSVAAHLGLVEAPSYSGSKAFVSTYLEGIRAQAEQSETDLTVTTIEPGYVDTELSLGGFWECSVETAVDQIYADIRAEREHAFVTRRWRAVAALLDIVPNWVTRRVRGDKRENPAP